jgi:two-component system, NarL family, sensor kinase
LLDYANKNGGLNTKTVDRVELFIIIGIILSVILLGFLISSLFLNQRRHFKHLNEKQELQAHFEKELLQTQLEIQEQSFRYISQEIHDNIGQVLSLAKFTFKSADFNDLEKLRSQVNLGVELIGNAIHDLRHLSKTLNPDYIAELGLKQLIARELEQLAKSGIIKPDLIIEGEELRLPQEKELIIFRIFQETINNSIKHSNANEIVIKLTFSPAIFTLEMKDNGKGFDTSILSNNKTSGLGLMNIRNRSKLIGATIDIESGISKGTKVVIKLPASLD